MTDSKHISVYVVNLSTAAKKRKYWSFQWIDPVTRKRKTESSKCTTKRAAERAAVDFEAELNRDQPNGKGAIPFDIFIERYDEGHLSTLKSNSRRRVLGVLNVFQNTINPANLSVITTSVMSDYVSQLRKEKREETTISTHISRLATAFSWAVDEGYLRKAPQMPRLPKPKRTRAKGRPLTAKEFMTFLRAVTPVVGRDRARPWRRFLIGLWLSGLRLEEAVTLVWGCDNASDSTLWVDVSGKYPLLGIVGESEKGNEDRLLPITPDFGQWLLKIPDYRRTGYVFPLPKVRRHQERNADHIGKMISEIGEKSGIIVNSKGKKASSHDFRRSFGLRWAQTPGVTPAELQQLMRHADIATTMKYYALVDATNFAEKLWKLNTTLPTTPRKNDSNAKS